MHRTIRIFQMVVSLITIIVGFKVIQRPDSFPGLCCIIGGCLYFIHSYCMATQKDEVNKNNNYKNK